MHADAVAGNRQVFGGDGFFFHGRAYGGKKQDVLEVFFEISGDVPAVWQTAGNFSGNAFVTPLCFLPFGIYI